MNEIHVVRMWPKAEAKLKEQRGGRSIHPTPAGVLIGWTEYIHSDAIVVRDFLTALPEVCFWEDGPQPEIQPQILAAAERLLIAEATSGVRPYYHNGHDGPNHWEARVHSAGTVHLD